METFTFFWDGPFSQWHPCTFRLDGDRYNCAEQFMMAEKARYFMDDDALAAIMRADHPRDQNGSDVKSPDSTNLNGSTLNPTVSRTVGTSCFAAMLQSFLRIQSCAKRSCARPERLWLRLLRWIRSGALALRPMTRGPMSVQLGKEPIGSVRC